MTNTSSLMTKIPQKLCIAFLITVLATVFSCLLMYLKTARDIEALTFDIRQVAFSPDTKTDPNIVIVLLDEQTMKDLPYRTPIPRDFLAKLHNNIVLAHPKIIGYDIFFKSPSFESADLALIDAFSRYKPYAVAPRRDDGTVDMPMQAFSDKLAGVGLSDLPFNPFDTKIRSSKFIYDTSLGPAKSFAAMIYEAATGLDAQTILSDKNLWPHFSFLKLTPFLNDTDQTLIRFSGPFKTYSASMVVKGLVPASWLENKIVLVGAGYEDLKDVYLTPYFSASTNYSKMNGVEIWANILSSLVTKQFYYAPTYWQGIVFSFVLAFVVALVSVFLSPFKSLVILLMDLFTIFGAAIFSFKYFGIVMPITLPLAICLLVYIFGLAFEAITEGKERRFIKKVFAQYVPPAVVHKIIENPKMLKLGGEERIITSLFTDIASFTSISEQLDPKTLVVFLNDYLGRMNDILFRFGGTLDKYEGDAIIAFFNAPLDTPNHEMAAALSAIEICKASADISKKWEAKCGRSIITRIGINSGPAVVGNMGSEGRFDYTAIGDTVNLASRLEGENKVYGTNILAAESTALKLDDTIIKRQVDRVRVKGKSEEVLVYEIIGLYNKFLPFVRGG